MVEQGAQSHQMNHAELLIRFESQKKSPVIGAALNFLIPGAAYFYCDRAGIGFGLLIGGIVWYVFCAALAAAEPGAMPVALGLLWLFAVLMFAIGVAAVSSYNKKLADRLLGTVPPTPSQPAG